MSQNDIGKVLGIKPKRRLECLLFAHIENFSLDELFFYAEKLSIPLQIINEEEIPAAITKKNIPLVRKSANGRSRKHL